MTKIYGYAALFAAMSLASCSSDNEPNVVPAGAMNDAYVTVNIATPISTRADYTYREGSTEESAVNSATFYVFDTEHKYLASVTHADFDWNNSDVEGIDKTSKKILKITKDADKEVGYIMTVLNGPALDNLIVGTTTVDQVRVKVADYKKNGNYFVMTNSAYNATDTENNAYVPYATDVRGYVFDNIGAAQNNPCDIYVERVAARVDVKEGKSADDVAFGKEFEVAGVTADNEAMSIKVEIDGIGFINEAVNTNLVKNIAGLDNTSAFAGWDDSANFRTHWGVNYADFATKPLYYAGVTSSVENASNVEAYRNGTWYLNENFDSANATHIVVTGHLTVNGEAAVIYTVLANGKNYLEDGAENTLCGYLEIDGYKFVKETTEGTTTTTETKTVNPEDITIVAGDADYDGYPEITVPAGFELYKGNAKQEVTNGKLVVKGDNYRVLKYGGAKNYYYAEINPTAQTKAGVVRNHIYDMTFNSIGGLGVPVFDPNSELKIKDLPDSDSDDAWYFNATINILKWTVYTQGVDFK